MSNLSVFSEIGKLKAVAIHDPGPEVDIMTPSLMHELLFDDILFGNEARKEHAVFRQILAKVADHVLDVQHLLGETLAKEEAKKHFLEAYTVLHKIGPGDLHTLEAKSPIELAAMAVGGWCEDINHGQTYSFHFPPVPNLLFMRDPAAVIGHGVSINNMATSARKPEPFILETILRFHPKFSVRSENDILFNTIPSFMEGKEEPDHTHTIEGGDILVLSHEILAIGVSIRTAQSAVTMLAERLRKRGEFKTLLMVLIPHERNAMHLDTIFTQIDEEHCLCFPPYLDPKSRQCLPVIKMDLTANHLQVELKDSFIKALREDGLDFKPVFCGGQKRLFQEREQWTDGANSFCLAPGVILGYDRNIRTADELDRHGYKVVKAGEVLKKDVNLLDGNKYFIQIKANELSRARGGPRCMTMPLRRES